MHPHFAEHMLVMPS